MILHEIGIATRLGIPRSALVQLRKSARLKKREHWTIEHKTVLYTPAGGAVLLQSLGLPADALDEKSAPLPSPVSAVEALRPSPEKNVAPATTLWTVIKLNPLNWTQCTARNAGGDVAMLLHGLPEAIARRIVPGKTTFTCRYLGGQWRRVEGADRMPPPRPTL